MGMLMHKNSPDTWLWQIESNGSWRGELGEWQDGIYLAASGPTLMDHAWQIALAPNESFTSVPVAVCHCAGGLDAAFTAMTQFCRAIVRAHIDHTNLPIIFNDYMNCLMEDPDEDKIKALLQPAVKGGAEYYSIDAGWYADDSDWWDDVGMWEPSEKRFPPGFGALMKVVSNQGLTPGVWLEPEVIGVRSIAAKELPETAFFQDNGQRVEERGRFQLDFMHLAVRERLGGIVLVEEYGIGYSKFDYNIDVVTGSDAHGGISTGAAHLEQPCAYLSWIE
jgi:alpha-galactosidase